MPELPEIETVRRGLERETVGRRVRSVDVPVAKATQRNGSRKAFQARLEGAKIRNVDRRGSLLVQALDTGELLVFDVGETGQLLRAAPKDEPPKDLLLSITFTQGGQLRLSDPEAKAEAFVVTPELLLEEVPALAELGLDPRIERWTAAPGTVGFERREDALALVRRRLCLDPSRDEELAEALGERLARRDGAWSAGATGERGLATIWFDTRS
jgi:formamidopyrimidine-DNA glycosylase